MGCSSPRGCAGGDSGGWTARRGDWASSWRSSSPARVQAATAHVQPPGCPLQVCRGHSWEGPSFVGIGAVNSTKESAPSQLCWGIGWLGRLDRLHV